MKEKTFFIIFKGLSVVRNCVRPESEPLKQMKHACFNQKSSPFSFKVRCQLIIMHVTTKEILEKGRFRLRQKQPPEVFCKKKCS